MNLDSEMSTFNLSRLEYLLMREISRFSRFRTQFRQKIHSRKNDAQALVPSRATYPYYSYSIDNDALRVITFWQIAGIGYSYCLSVKDLVNLTILNFKFYGSDLQPWRAQALTHR